MKTGSYVSRKRAKPDHNPQAGECSEVRKTTARVALIVFSRTDGGRSKRNCRISGDNQQSESTQIQTEVGKATVELEDSESWLVKTTQSIRVPRVSNRR